MVITHSALALASVFYQIISLASVESLLHERQQRQLNNYHQQYLNKWRHYVLFTFILLCAVFMLTTCSAHLHTFIKCLYFFIILKKVVKVFFNIELVFIFKILLFLLLTLLLLFAMLQKKTRYAHDPNARLKKCASSASERIWWMIWTFCCCFCYFSFSPPPLSLLSLYPQFLFYSLPFQQQEYSISRLLYATIILQVNCRMSRELLCLRILFGLMLTGFYYFFF